MSDRAAADRIIVALDVPSESKALELVMKLKGAVGLFKIGLELLNLAGFEVVRKITQLGAHVFLDCKFMDIPNTVAGASKGATRLGVKMFNVHTLGGVEMMAAAVQTAKQEAVSLGIEPPMVLGVTILTSIDQTTMNEQLGISGDIEAQVVHLARLAERAGLDGVIASAKEALAIRSSLSKSMVIVTPGIRPSWSVAQDQKRIATPTEAIRNGASYLVIGRPITQPPPEIGTQLKAAKLIAREITMAIN